MTKTIIAAAALLIVGVVAYTPAIPFAADLDCTSCIRGGYDYCIYGTSDGKTPTGNTWECLKEAKNPEYVFPSDGKPNGYVCSNAMASKTAAIIAGCRPAINQAKPESPCGSYAIDLSTVSAFDTRSIQSLPVGQSCTYRVFSTCGYPNAAVKILNPVIAQDFDINYAAEAGLGLDEDLASDWKLDTKVEWEGAFGTGTDDAMDFVSQGYSSPMIAKADFDKCKQPERNLWITVTRVKVTPNPTTFLDMTPRQLQTKFHDIEFGFASIQGNAKFLGALSFALVALLSVFAF